MTKMKRTIAVLLVAAGFVVAAGAAQALSSVFIVWRGIGTGAESVAASTTLIADIVLTADTNGVAGIQITISFDATELQVIGGGEFTPANLPGMGNQFDPLTIGVTVDNTTGTISRFDQATLTTGLSSGDTATLGSFKFHVVGAAGTIGDDDVLANTGGIGDGLLGQDNITVSGTFSGAQVFHTPEPTTAVLLLAGLVGLGYAGRRSLR